MLHVVNGENQTDKSQNGQDAAMRQDPETLTEPKRHSPRSNQAMLRSGRAGAMPPQPPLRPSQTIRLQRKCACGNPSVAGGECEECKQKKEEETTVQRRETPDQTPDSAPSIVHEVLRTPGQPLDGAIRQFMGSRLGGHFSQAPRSGQAKLVVGQPGGSYEQEANLAAEQVLHSPASELITSLSTGEEPVRHNFDQVRIHADSQAAESARAMNALAYTVGNDVIFASGQYAPETAAGKKLLAHELAHVLQQGGNAGTGLVQRAETDTAYGCGGLDDTATDVNVKTNEAIKKAYAISTVPKDVCDAVYRELGGRPIAALSMSNIEAWASQLALNPFSNKARKPNPLKTKYWGVNTKTKIPVPLVSLLAPIMKIKGYCVGSDKLGHFFEQGHEYFDITHTTGKTVADADAYGVKTEEGFYGLTGTGVFSNADLEANRQGLNFYEDLFKTPSMTFDIAKYINGNWNEETNPNSYETAMGGIVWKNLINGDWRGTFNNTSSSAPPVGIDTTLVVTSTTDFSGEYEHSPRIGSFFPKVKGEILNGKIDYNYDTHKAISGVRLTYDWKTGSASGKGYWNSVGEYQMSGKWGSGTSSSDGGDWFMNKKL